MKDIRDEITERLDDANKRRVDLAGQIKAIDSEVELLKRMMGFETKRLLHKVVPSLVSLKTAALDAVTSAPDFIEGLLKTSPQTKDQLKEAGIQRGIFDPDTAGRTLHITLLNMLRGKRIRELPNGLYGPPEDRSPQRSDPPGAT